MKALPVFSRSKTVFSTLILLAFFMACKPKNASAPSPSPSPNPSVSQPTLLTPICQAAQNVFISGCTKGATVSVFKNGTAIGSATASSADVSISLTQSLAVGDKLTVQQKMGSQSGPISAAIEVTSGGATTIKIIGGEPFFQAENGEQQVDAPVFLRGNSSGVTIAISSCCMKKVIVEIKDPKGKIIASPTIAGNVTGSFSITWDWKTTMNAPIPSGVSVGKYTASVRSECEPNAVEVPFYVIFNPAEVGGAARFCFNETNVWFGAHQNASRALLYHLHPDDARVFGMAIAACSGQTEAAKAVQNICDAEEKRFAYSLNYHTDDVLDLLARFTETQCADDANFLTALIRSVGIPAHTTTADAALETGDATWTFDTWTEFQVPTGGGKTDWLIFHPHEYPDMKAETRPVFGKTRGVATKSFNDLIIMADENWQENEAADGSVDVSYTRTVCNEPDKNLTKKNWLIELSDKGYWETPFYDCSGITASRSMSSKSKLELDLGNAGFGRSLAGVVSTAPGSPFSRGVGGLPTVQVVGDLPESMKFPDTVFSTKTLSFSKSVGVPTAKFDLSLPPTAPAGMELWVVSNSGNRVMSAQPFSLSSALKIELKLPSALKMGDETTLEVVILNESKAVVNDVSVSVAGPFSLNFEGNRTASIGTMQPGEGKTVSWKIKTIAPMEAGELVLKVNSSNGGGATAMASFSIQ